MSYLEKSQTCLYDLVKIFEKITKFLSFYFSQLDMSITWQNRGVQLACHDQGHGLRVCVKLNVLYGLKYKEIWLRCRQG